MRRWRLWWLKLALKEQSTRHKTGYEWAMRELHRGNDPDRYLIGDHNGKYGSNWAFDMGAADAIRDFSKINADAMWNKRKELLT